MCGTCGCGASQQEAVDAGNQQVLHLHQSLLAKNDRYAEQNRALFRHLLAINLLSSPGAGKTTLVQRLLGDRDLIAATSPLSQHQGPVKAGVIVGDLATDRDAERLRQTGAPVVQITTGTLCHLEADMVARAAQALTLADLNLLIIENVGNLVCPAAYDLGEDLRLVLMSVTEGEDKPLKYPTMFKSAHAVIISKIDLAEVVGFKRAEALHYLHLIAPQALVFELSATTGEGLASFYAYLEQAIFQCHRKVSSVQAS
ncbi:hydrogenase nickel incorporation protein HypB [Nodosilinea sp. LEGE 07088]|uniref:hydrogenase nickel incorporation protein HypB n=1 Tax=Nodosilinea sp. LEGE 07088 TaxID=2777968 RepID=UPI001882A8B1|nr:hydrogenase nickel incorporation protein HypB [Nodosilinea sp. LEGE 07088]MBE9137085.1 hydrogenase nickel incorporation protein HypB [Nodosilinea sp. LEGE 07088]